jgi:hypothetical protein
MLFIKDIIPAKLQKKFIRLLYFLYLSGKFVNNQDAGYKAGMTS